MNDQPEVYDVPAIKAKLLEKMGERSALYPTQIEQQFPRILAKIADLWGTPALDAYLDQMMVSDRPNRHGFPPEVATDMFRLSTAHSALALAPKTVNTGWAGVDDAALEKRAFVKGR